MQNHPEAHGLFYAFMNQSRDFVLGFEMGRFYDTAKRSDIVEDLFHVSNEGEMLRLASNLGFARVGWETKGDWAFGKFERRGGGPTP